MKQRAELMRTFVTLVAAFLPAMASAGQPEVSPRKAAAEIRAVLRAADKIELLRLEGLEGRPEHEATSNTFHGYPVLGSLTLSKDDRSAIITEVAASISRSPLRMVACFFPRHGIRATLANEVVDLLICFECSTVYYLRAGESRRLNIDETPEKVLNRLLANASIRQGSEASGSS